MINFQQGKPNSHHIACHIIYFYMWREACRVDLRMLKWSFKLRKHWKDVWKLQNEGLVYLVKNHLVKFCPCKLWFGEFLQNVFSLLSSSYLYDIHTFLLDHCQVPSKFKRAKSSMHLRLWHSPCHKNILQSWNNPWLFLLHIKDLEWSNDCFAMLFYLTYK